MIAIIGAMEQEVEAIKNRMNSVSEKRIAHTLFYEGILEGKSVVLSQSGIGKVNASVSTTLLFQHYDVDYVINIGTAGGIKADCNVLDLVISNQVGYHDVDVTGFNYSLGQVPGMPSFYESNQELIHKVKTILEKEHFPYHEGLIVSGDSFINRPDQIELIKKNFNEAIAVEMEAASIAQVCHVFKKPFIILRSLSDIAGKESNISFDAYLEQAAANSSRFIEALIK
jgi:adenosylhomocysteine nucleosidase